MHKNLKYFVYEKKKIRRLDYSIHLINQFFDDLHISLSLNLLKPRSNQRTAKIFKNHQSCLKGIKDGNFTIEKMGDYFIVGDVQKKLNYEITLSFSKAHTCGFVCLHCKFCLHNFRCTCSGNMFSQEFCVHLHTLSTVLHLLPNFERPINQRLTYFNSVVRGLVGNQQQIENNCNQPISFSAALPEGVVGCQLPFDSQQQASTQENEDFFSQDIPQDDDFAPQDNEDAFERAVQNLSDAHATFGLYIKKLKKETRIHSQEEIDIVNDLHSQICSGLPIMSSICGSIELEHCKRGDRQRVLHETDKQIRLVPVPQSNRAGRPKSTKVLQKPDSPEKRKIEKDLIEGVNHSKKIKLKASLKKVSKTKKASNQKSKVKKTSDQKQPKAQKTSNSQPSKSKQVKKPNQSLVKSTNIRTRSSTD